jgi:hypothetical protein
MKLAYIVQIVNGKARKKKIGVLQKWRLNGLKKKLSMKRNMGLALKELKLILEEDALNLDLKGNADLAGLIVTAELVKMEAVGVVVMVAVKVLLQEILEVQAEIAVEVQIAEAAKEILAGLQE